MYFAKFFYCQVHFFSAHFSIAKCTSVLAKCTCKNWQSCPYRRTNKTCHMKTCSSVTSLTYDLQCESSCNIAFKKVNFLHKLRYFLLPSALVQKLAYYLLKKCTCRCKNWQSCPYRRTNKTCHMKTCSSVTSLTYDLKCESSCNIAFKKVNFLHKLRYFLFLNLS